MNKLPLSPVRYYDSSDIYAVDVDNRPLTDIANNIDIINNAIGTLGFIQYIQANPETEPVGGFRMYECVSVRENNLLYPINIATPQTVTDYSKYPIYLVTKIVETEGIKTYECISFAASLTLTGAVTRFLPESRGRKLKVSPTGDLVDEVFFDLYYSDYPYQSLYVGKVLSANSISFGGAQVAAHISGTDFLSKDINETTAGLVTIVRNTDDGRTVHQSLITSTDAGTSAYPYVEYKDTLLASNIAGTVGVYFTNSSINTTATGEFDLTKPLETYLNTVHFRSDVVSTASAQSNKFLTAGVNTQALLDFSGTSLLHSATYSESLGESSQTIGTSLQFKSTKNSTVISLPSISGSIGTAFSNGLPANLLSLTGTVSSGIGFDNSTGNATTNPILMVVKDTNTALTDVDENINTPRLAALAGSTNLVISSKSENTTSGAPANIMVAADGYVVLSATKGGFYNTPTYDSGGNTEIATVGLLNKNIEALRTDSLGNIVPLTGNNDGTPMTGYLAMDVTASSGNTLVKFKGTNAAQVQSSHPVAFTAYGTPSTLIAVRGRTPAKTDADPGTDEDFVTRQFLAAALSGSSSVVYTRKNSSEDVTGSWSFTNGLTVRAETNPTLTLTATATAYGNHGSVSTNGEYISVVQTSDKNKLVPLRAKTPVAADGVNAVTTVDYVANQLNAFQRQFVWAAWNQVSAYDTNSIISAAAPVSASALYGSFLTQYSDARGKYYKNVSKSTQVFQVAATINAVGINLAKSLNLVYLTDQTANVVASAALGSTGTSYVITAPGMSTTPTTNKSSFLSRFINKAATTNTSATVMHIVKLAPGQGFKFEIVDSSTNSVETSLTAFGTVELLTTED